MWNAARIALVAIAARAAARLVLFLLRHNRPFTVPGVDGVSDLKRG
jgi:hypothetical protein